MDMIIKNVKRVESNTKNMSAAFETQTLKTI